MIQMKDPENILIFKINKLGDTVAFLPTLSAITQRYPNSQLTLICTSSVKELFDSNSHVSHIITVEGKHDFTGILKWRTFLRLYYLLKDKHYDVALCSYESFALIPLLTSVLGIKYRIGYEKYAKFSFLYNKKIAFKWDENVVKRDFHLYEMLTGENVDGSEILRSPLSIPPSILSWGTRLLGEISPSPDTRIIVVQPGSSLENRRWPRDNFKNLIHCILARNKDSVVVVIGTSQENELCNYLHEDAKERIINLCGQLSLLQLAFLLKEAFLFIGHSSGPFHIAQAMGTSTVTLWGPSDFTWWGPFWDRNRHFAITKNLPCSPCEYLKNNQVDCPLKSNACLNNITVKEVFSAVNIILNSYN